MAGVYKPQKDGSGNASPADPRDKLFLIKDGVKIYGGFIGTETLLSQRNWSNNKTILSGDIDNNDTNTDGNNINESHTDIVGSNVYHIAVFIGNGLNAPTVLDGFILTGGQTFSTAVSAPSQDINVAGVGNINVSSFRGAALMFSIATAQIKNCVITGNFSNSGVLYQNNQNSWANLVTTLENCYWTGNTSNSTGMIFFHRTWVNMINNVITNNTANGGVLYISSNQPGGNVININHLTFYNNTTTSSSPVYLQSGIVNITNSIIRNATLGSLNIINNTSTLTISNSNVLGSSLNGSWNPADGTNGGNNMDLPPLFSNTANIIGVDNKYFTADDGLTLTSCSPMINKGSTGLTTDVMGNARPFESQTDIGAYEFQSASTVPADPTTVSASSTSVTCGQSVTLSATCTTGTVTWYNVFNGGTSIGTGTGLSVTPLANPSVYYAACETSATCINITRISTGNITVTLPTDPTNITVSSTAVCPGTQVSLSANCTGGAIPEWYNGATALSTTTPFTPTVTSNITYSVKCKSGSCYSNAVNAQPIVILGTPTNITTSIRNICGNTIPAITFSATCAVGTVRWYNAPSGGSLVGTGSPFVNTPVNPTPGFNRYYPSCSNGTCESNRGSGESFVYTPVPSNVTANPSFICSTSSVTLSASCSNGSLNWYSTATGGASIGTTNSISQTVSTTTTYYAECTNNFLSICNTDRVPVTVTLESTPPNPTNVSTDKTLVCPGSNVSLSATCSSGTIKWYNSATGGAALGTGSPLVQMPSTTTTYYAACESVSCGNSSRIPTQTVQVSSVGSNLNLTTNISGTSIQTSSNTITATNTVLAGANVKYLANNSITLNPLVGGGFQVANGAVFEAKIMALSGCN
ncbi:hypothetical protein GCM10011514_09260 [Emticicia aquatilis]|uniref:Ig-like domain-containing protein n=1 Tax=Emticicia aquatilis TaxID=1537369 RepID=A0A916YIT8_9BACT|nr:3-coathanger stack domain-containing protein [Emticicia aquatilis]GGD47421.1 hypothetical protein GCM10011514_09260 [Emticicia aquatilis]